MIGEINKNTPTSTYQPSDEICKFTAGVKEDYSYGVNLLNRSWKEYNDRTILEDESRGQMMFNAFVDTSVETAGEAWKWRGTRSMARNKGIAMHANLTANFLLPMFMAQNENDEIDVGFSEVMRDVIEWMAQPTNSEYQSSFLQVVFGMLTNPVTYMGAEYCEVYQKIRERQEDGSITIKEIVDQVLSGFKAPIWSAEQVLITNIYERNIQKQRRIIKRRWVEKGELEAKYGDHPNWEYVKTGTRSVYDESSQCFYDIKDDEHPNLVAEEIAMDRREDSEVPFLNGIYMGDPESVENNPICHRDNRGAPKYNVVPFGYMRIGEHFFYFKSMMNALGWDNDLYDALSEIGMNRAILESEVPIAVSGSDEINSDVIFPNAVIAFENPEAKIHRLLPETNSSHVFNALRETEKSMEEGSVDKVTSGQLPDKDQKVGNVAAAQAQAKKMLGAVGKSLAESVVKYGDLMKDIAINHITAPEVEELVGDDMKLKYRTFILENKEMGGKMVPKTVKFDPELIGAEMTDDEKDQAELSLLEDSGYPEHKNSLVLVNPELFAKFNYLTKVDVEEMFAKTPEYWQAVLPALKAQLAKDPYTDQEFLTREIGRAFFRSKGDRLVKKPDPMPQQTGAPEGMGAMSNMVVNKQLSTAASGAGI